MFGSQFDIPWSCSSRKLRTKKLDLSAGTLVFTSKRTEMAVNYGMFISQIHLENNPSLDSELHATWQSAQLHHTDRVSVFGLALVAHPEASSGWPPIRSVPLLRKVGNMSFPVCQSSHIFGYSENKQQNCVKPCIKNHPKSARSLHRDYLDEGHQLNEPRRFCLRAASLRLRSDGSDGLESSPLFYANNA